MKYPHRNIAVHDIHLGHHNTPTQHIADNLLTDLSLERLQDIDILYFTGDLLDKILSYADGNVPIIQSTMYHLGHRCLKANTAFRLLKGTPSHDGDQCEALSKLLKQAYPDLDFRYVKDMEIEYHPGFDMTILYVPDEYTTREEMMLIARRLLKERSLEQVDFIIGHNQFGYQFIPTVRMKISTLNEEEWNAIVKHTAYFGHVHKRSSYNKIQVAGSYDRLCHGEEDPKGFLEGIYYSEDHQEIVFHENTNAMRYYSIHLPDDFDIGNESHIKDTFSVLESMSVEDRLTKIGYIRLVYQDKQLAIDEIIKSLRLRYPLFRFTSIHKTNIQDDIKGEPLPEDTVYDFIDINKDNILRLMELEFDKQQLPAERKVNLLKQVQAYVEDVS